MELVLFLELFVQIAQQLLIQVNNCAATATNEVVM